MSSQTAIRIGIVGDRRADNASHVATEAALQHAGCGIGEDVQAEWLSTREISEDRLRGLDGILCSPGSPYASPDGAIEAIRFARTNGLAFLGTCGGFQHMVIEYARSVLGFPRAEHEETAPGAPELFISRLTCSLIGKSQRVRIRPGTRLGSIHAADESVEQFWCSFGVNPNVTDQLVAGGLVISATDDEGSIRAVELPEHRFFIGTLFIPQLSSSPQRPHPVLLGFLNAASRSGRRARALAGANLTKPSN